MRQPIGEAKGVEFEMSERGHILQSVTQKSENDMWEAIRDFSCAWPGSEICDQDGWGAPGRNEETKRARRTEIETALYDRMRGAYDLSGEIFQAH